MKASTINVTIDDQTTQTKQRPAQPHVMLGPQRKPQRSR